MSSVTVSPCRILVAVDEKWVQSALTSLIKEQGFQALEADDGRSAIEIIRQGDVDAVVLDVKMLGGDGLNVLHKARRLGSGMPSILITGAGCVSAAAGAGGDGAGELVAQSAEVEKLFVLIREVINRRPAGQESHQGGWQEGGTTLWPEVMGSSEQIRRVIAHVEQVAPTRFTVLITGETGSGKEMVANAIHSLSRRSGGPFVPVDCGSIPQTLIESELFGHEKGAFTSADRTNPGKFEVASGGALFLDEISNLPLEVQPKLLRALEEKKIWRVGGTKPIEVDIRVIAASNENLLNMVREGRFRLDLYYRLSEFCIRIPPLRERRDDIMFFAEQFLRLTNSELHKQVRGFSDAALGVLLSYRWPGNVRELRNVIRRAVLMADGQIAPDELGILEASGGAEPPLPTGRGEFDGSIPLRKIVHDAVAQVEKSIIARALEQTGGNKARAARLLHIDYKTLYKKLSYYGISRSL